MFRVQIIAKKTLLYTVKHNEQCETVKYRYIPPKSAFLA